MQRKDPRRARGLLLARGTATAYASANDRGDTAALERHASLVFARRRATEFLRRYTPFNRMSDAALAFLVSRLQHAHFAKDATILATHTGPVTNLHIVERGLVGSRPDNAQADPDRTLGPGELFPVGALSAGGTTTKIFSALDDTDCYLLARDDFLELRRQSPEFERYCTQAITETLKQSLESLYSQYSQRAAEQQTPHADARGTGSQRPGRVPRDADRCARRRKRWPTPRCARSSPSVATMPRSGCSPSSICCAAWCCPVAGSIRLWPT